MSIDLRPEFIRENYEVHEWKYACAILHPDFPNEWDSNLNFRHSARLCRVFISTFCGESA